MTEPLPLLEYANPLADQPIGSRALCERHADGGITFTLPPEGVLRALPGLILVGVPIVAMLAWMIVITAEHGKESGALCGLIVVLPFGALWALLLRASRRPTVISVRRGTVTLNSGAALFSPVTWPASDVISVRVSFSGMSARIRIVGDLKLDLRRGPRYAHLLIGGDKAELDWIARGLREELHLPAL